MVRQAALLLLWSIVTKSALRSIGNRCSYDMGSRLDCATWVNRRYYQVTVYVRRAGKVLARVAGRRSTSEVWFDLGMVV